MRERQGTSRDGPDIIKLHQHQKLLILELFISLFKSLVSVRAQLQTTETDLASLNMKGWRSSSRSRNNSQLWEARDLCLWSGKQQPPLPEGDESGSCSPELQGICPDLWQQNGCPMLFSSVLNLRLAQEQNLLHRFLAQGNLGSILAFQLSSSEETLKGVLA